MHDLRPFLGVPTNNTAEYAAGVIVSHSAKGGPAMLAPGLVNTNNLNQMEQDKHGIWRPVKPTGQEMLIPWPQRGNPPRHTFGTADLAFLPHKHNYLNTHGFVNIDKFDFDKVQKILEFVKANHSLSLVIECPKAMLSFLSRFRDTIAKHFLYFDNRRHHMPGNLSTIKGDQVVLVLTFMNLPLCTPIYNSRKVNGMGLMASMVWEEATEKTGKLTLREEFWMLMSHEKTNVLTVDGTMFANNNLVASSMIGHMKGEAENEKLRREGKPEKKRPVKKSQAVSF